MRVVRRTEHGTVHTALGFGEPAAAVNNSSARGLALMAQCCSACLVLLLKARPGMIRPSMRIATSMTLDSTLRARLLARAHDEEARVRVLENLRAPVYLRPTQISDVAACIEHADYNPRLFWLRESCYPS